MPVRPNPLGARSACGSGYHHSMTTVFLVAEERGERAERILTGLQWTLGLRARSRPRTWDTAAVPLPEASARREVVERLDAVDPDWRDVVALV
jgi:hypothetical protein